MAEDATIVREVPGKHGCEKETTILIIQLEPSVKESNVNCMMCLFGNNFSKMTLNS